MKHLPIVLCGLLAIATARAAVTATTFDLSWTGSLPVPDNSGVGASSTLAFNAPEWNSIQVVTVELRFTGGWNGDQKRMRSKVGRGGPPRPSPLGLRWD